MGFLSGLFYSRDKPTNSTNGSAYRFLFGGSNSGKAVNERSAMQMTAVYACKAGNIDMIITKSISRFARNTLDCLKYIRQLKDMNIPVLFEKESINTMDAKGEVLITIMASLAQQESQSLSQNIKMGLQYRYQQGKQTVSTVFSLSNRIASPSKSS